MTTNTEQFSSRGIAAFLQRGNVTYVMMSDKDLPGITEEQQGGAMEESKDFLSTWERCVRDDVNELQLLIPDMARKRIVAIRNGDKWMLPQCFGHHMNSANAPDMMNELKLKLGFNFSVTILRWIWNREKEISEAWVARSVIIFETHEDPIALPQGWEWVNIEEADVNHCDEEGRHAIREELNSILEQREPDLRVAWGRVGWFTEKAEWMCGVLRSHGLEVMGPVIQLKATMLCSILRVNTDKGFYFLKCSPIFCNEAAITSVLCKVAPSFVAKPLLIDTEERITISADHGKEWGLMDNGIEESELPQFFRDLAELQKASMSAIPELEAAGMMVLSTEWMEENLDFLLENEELKFLKDNEEFKYMKRWKAYIIRALREVRNANLPTTFVHGDLPTGNMFRPGGTSGSFCFFDWNQSHIGCCLSDLFIFSPKTFSVYCTEMGIALTKVGEVDDAVGLLTFLSRAFRTLNELIHVEEQAKCNCQDALKLQVSLVWTRVKWAVEKFETSAKTTIAN